MKSARPLVGGKQPLDFGARSAGSSPQHPSRNASRGDAVEASGGVEQLLAAAVPSRAAAHAVAPAPSIAS